MEKYTQAILNKSTSSGLLLNTKRDIFFDSYQSLSKRELNYFFKTLFSKRKCFMAYSKF